ncbi:MAG: class I SAM-dependent methyltransferase, partial [Anaerolineae bacterium]|nr:class I SAM-dependent methyltransferase [Anaerolineae bacterium]
MIHELLKTLDGRLACPYCLGHLEHQAAGLYCSNCVVTYPILRDSQIDLRLQQAKKVYVEYEVGESLENILGFSYQPLRKNQNPEVEFGNQAVPKKFTEELRSFIPKASGSDAVVLDIGCGLMPPKEMLEFAGYSYIGLDYKNDAAHILGDAHALPFHDNSFDLVVSMNVLEHLQYPHVVYSNINRVLKRNCFFIGSVSFLEPFHDNSFYHHTHLGAYSTLAAAGFSIVAISPNLHWPVLTALVEMDALPRTARP